MSREILLANLASIRKRLGEVKGLIPHVNSLVRGRVKEMINLFFSTLGTNFREIVDQDAKFDSIAFKSFPETPYPTLAEGILSGVKLRGDKTVVFQTSADDLPRYVVTAAVPYIGYVDFIFVLGGGASWAIELVSPISSSAVVEEEELSFNFSTLTLESLPLRYILLSTYANKLVLDLSMVGYSERELDLANFDEVRKAIGAISVSSIYALLLHNSLATEGDLFQWAQDLFNRWKERFARLTPLQVFIQRKGKEHPFYLHFYFRGINKPPQSWRVQIHASHYGRRTRQSWALPIGEIVIEKELEGVKHYIASFTVNLVVSFLFYIPIKRRTNIDVELGIRVSLKETKRDFVYIFEGKIESMFEDELRQLDKRITVPVGGELPVVDEIWKKDEPLDSVLGRGCRRVAAFVGKKME